jgi:AraC family transcriptional regulator
MRGERQTKSGTTLVRKTAGQVTVILKGPIPEMRLVSQAELVYCSFDGHFIERIAEDITNLRPERLVFRSGLRDKSIHLLMQMLVAEFDVPLKQPGTQIQRRVPRATTFDPADGEIMSRCEKR